MRNCGLGKHDAERKPAFSDASLGAAAETAQQARVHAALAGDWSLLLSTHIRQLTSGCNSSSRRPIVSLLEHLDSHAHTQHTDTHTYIHMIKIIKINRKSV